MSFVWGGYFCRRTRGHHCTFHPVAVQLRATTCPTETVKVSLHLSFPSALATDTVYLPADTTKAAFVRWLCCFPLIVTVAPAGSDEITSLPKEGICAHNETAHRRTETSTTFDDVLYLTLVLPT
jgi:hypothetical protein